MAENKNDEIKVTYESLYDILRREKSKVELQEISPTFYSDVADYLTEKKVQLAQNPEEMRTQIFNAKKLLKDIYNHRETKVIALASSGAKSGNEDILSKPMLDSEKKLATSLLMVFKQARLEVIDPIIVGKSPQKAVVSNQKQEKKEVSTQAPASEATSAQSSASEPAKVTLGEGRKVTFIADVPKFVGPNMDVYGPFKTNDSVVLPEKIVRVLVKKEKVRLV